MAGTRKKKVEEVIPLMANAGEVKASSAQTATRTRRNRASGIIRTDRFKNIDEGLVPYKYSKGFTFTPLHMAAWMGHSQVINDRDLCVLLIRFCFCTTSIRLRLFFNCPHGRR